MGQPCASSVFFGVGGDVGLLHLEGSIEPAFAGELREAALVLAAQGTDAVVDCSAAERVSTAALQILCAFKAALGARGRALRLTQVNPVVAEQIAAVGLQEVLLDAPDARYPDSNP